MKTKIIMTRMDFRKEGNKWVGNEKVAEEITHEQYENFVNSKSAFKKMGFYEKHNKSYTYAGYVVTEINSITPDRKQKKLRTFDFYLYN